MGIRNPGKTYLTAALALLLLAQCMLGADARRVYSSGSRKSSSQSSSSHSRRTGSSSSAYQPKSSYSHSDATKLSYGGGTHAQPSHSSSLNTRHSSQAASAAPIGWNVPKNQGPPPAYSATNPAGGAKTNIHERPPAYNPSAPPASSVHQTSLNSQRPGYTPAQTYNPSSSNSNARPAYTPAQTYRPRQNMTGGFGSGGVHTPISATNAQNVHSSYPRQQLPAGATYYPSGSGLPAGATYHSPGALPPGATYHPSGLPAGASYHPSGGLPPGATYHSAGALPPGATYHPSGYPGAGGGYHAPAGIPPGATYYPHAPAAVPAGSTYLAPGAALPAGATYYAQPPVKSSSGLGFGSGLAAGAIGGAILGHVLTPTQTRVVEHAPSYGGGGGGGASNGGEDKIIIINNGPPGSVTTTDAGSGTTVINTNGGGGVAPAQAPISTQLSPMNPGPMYPQQPQQPGIAPAAEQPMTFASSALPAAAAGAAVTGAAIAGGAAAPVPPPDAPVNPTAGGAAPTGGSPIPAEQPPPGGIICTPILVNETDPTDSTKTVQVERIICYPAPPPETAPPAPVVVDGTTATPVAVDGTTAALAFTTPVPLVASVPLAPLNAGPPKPIHVPEGSVALAPIGPSQDPVIIRIPGDIYATQRVSTALMAEDSGVHIASANGAGESKYISFTLFSMLVAYCMY